MYQIPEGRPILSASLIIPIQKPVLVIGLPQSPYDLYRHLRERKEQGLDSEDPDKVLRSVASAKLLYSRVDCERRLGRTGAGKKYLASLFFSTRNRKGLEGCSFGELTNCGAGFCVGGEVRFESDFQSGNLLFCRQLGAAQKEEYQLVLHNDLNSRGYTQWFYFRIELTRKRKLTLFITNESKATSLFSSGMQPCLRTQVDGRWSQWARAGTAIAYFQNSRQKQNSSPDNPEYYSTLKFSLALDPGLYQIACSFPYTLTHLDSLLAEIGHRFTIKTIGRSVSGRPINMLEIGDSSSPIVFVIGRQHPGQTPASYLMDNFLRDLAVNRQLTKKLLFKVVPIVNVDGVFYGNYRSNLAGLDLNRHWHKSDQVPPQIAGIRQAILKDKDRIVLFLDLHAHTQKTGTFFYGNPDAGKADPVHKVLPLLACRLDSRFTFEHCSFSASADKERTARVFVSKVIKGCSYTIESSFWGWKDKSDKSDKSDRVKAYSEQDYRAMGSVILAAIGQVKDFLIVKMLGQTPKFQSQVDRQFYQAAKELARQLAQSGQLGADGGDGSDSQAEKYEHNQDDGQGSIAKDDAKSINSSEQSSSRAKPAPKQLATRGSQFRSVK